MDTHVGILNVRIDMSVHPTYVTFMIVHDFFLLPNLNYSLEFQTYSENRSNTKYFLKCETSKKDPASENPNLVMYLSGGASDDTVAR